MDRMCRKFSNPFRPEYSSLYESKIAEINDFGYFLFKGQYTMICSIQKVGSNSVHQFLQVLLEEHAKDELEQNALYLKAEEDGSFKPSAIFPVTNECWSDCATNHTKVMLVRHPLERLLSAYFYIFAQEGKYYYQELTWEEFVHNIINYTEDNSRWKMIQDEVGGHWEPYWRVCQVCDPNLKPSYILKLETLREDLKVYLGNIGLAQYSDRFPWVNSREGHSTSLRLLEYYSRLNRSTIEDLYRAYEMDHVLFNYDPKPFFELSSGNDP